MKQFIISLFAFLLSVAPLTSQAGGSKCHDCGYSPIGHTDNHGGKGGDGGRGGDGGHGYGGEGGKGGNARADQHQGQDQDQSQVANGGQGGSTGPVNNGGNQVHVEGDDFDSGAVSYSSMIAPDVYGSHVTVMDTDCIPDPSKVVKIAGATWVLGTKILAAAGAKSDSSAWKAGAGFFPFTIEGGTSKGHSEPVIITLKEVDDTGNPTIKDKAITCIALQVDPDFQSELMERIKREKEFTEKQMK